MRTERDDYRPTVVDPQALYLVDNYGIKPARAREIEEAMDAMAREMYAGGLVPVWRIVDRLAELTVTKEEYAWACVTHIMWLAARGYLPNTNPRDLLKRRPPPQN
jgi:hypothetical protein